MSDESNELGRRVVLGRMNRRDFLGRAAALGVSASFANTLLASVVRAEGRKRAACSRPACRAAPPPTASTRRSGQARFRYFFGRQWGEQLVQISPDGEVKPALAEESGASDDAKVWTLQDPQGRRSSTTARR